MRYLTGWRMHLARQLLCEGTAGVFTGSRSMTVAGLVPGRSYMFQVRSIGGSTGYTDWSNPVSHMCA